MKKFLLLFVAIAAIAATGCSKKDDNSFKYDMNVVYGTWKGIAMKVDGEWIDITKYPYTEFGFSATFNSNGTYSGKGYFGTGSGTYEAVEDTLITYINDTEYARYQILSISDNVADMIMKMGKSSLEIRCQKQ